MGIPARDLFPVDLLLIESRGIPESTVRDSALYVPVKYVEIEAFCGTPLGNGQRCETIVAHWGDRCPEHMEDVDDGQQSI